MLPGNSCGLVLTTCYLYSSVAALHGNTSVIPPCAWSAIRCCTRRKIKSNSHNTKLAATGLLDKKNKPAKGHPLSEGKGRRLLRYIIVSVQVTKSSCLSGNNMRTLNLTFSGRCVPPRLPLAPFPHSTGRSGFSLHCPMLFLFLQTNPGTAIGSVAKLMCNWINNVILQPESITASQGSLRRRKQHGRDSCSRFAFHALGQARHTHGCMWTSTPLLISESQDIQVHPPKPCNASAHSLSDIAVQAHAPAGCLRQHNLHVKVPECYSTPPPTQPMWK